MEGGGVRVRPSGDAFEEHRRKAGPEHHPPPCYLGVARGVPPPPFRAGPCPAHRPLFPVSPSPPWPAPRHS